MIRFFKKYPKQTDAVLLVLGFVIGMNFMAIMKLAGMQPDPGYTDSSSFHSSIPTLLGLTVGLALVVAEYALFDRLYSTLAHWQVIIIRLVITAVLIVSGVLSVAVAYRMVYSQLPFKVAFGQATDFLQTPLALSFVVYMLFLSILLNFFRQLGNHFGHGLIFNFITGRYSQLQEEHRTFMFIDLDHSTTLAEQLGHVKYSRLLNRCFGDLSEFLPRYDADVYQYVGDEVVLTWLTSSIKPHMEVPALYFDFQERLKQQASIYQDKFGVVPTFKASLHSGLVSITQIGRQRKELAYHGDVLNTASRVLALASTLGKTLLITSPLIDNIQKDSDYEARLIDTLLLRGKQEKVDVFEVVKKTYEYSTESRRLC